MRTALALVLVCLVSAVRLRAEDPHPDFTGSWIVESVAAAGGGRVTIETTLDTPFGKRSITATLTRREG
ncbi:MAG TPA: hypothetical protein VGQ37_16560 [Vicinamibacterales bacterium]|jgi:hypothetical protein|nr:hypothetical protein [Vicinamibacterales bacterium]